MTDPVLIHIRPASDADASLWRLTHEVAEILQPGPPSPLRHVVDSSRR